MILPGYAVGAREARSVLLCFRAVVLWSRPVDFGDRPKILVEAPEDKGEFSGLAPNSTLKFGICLGFGIWDLEFQPVCRLWSVASGRR